MRTITIICDCRSLAGVVDKQIVAHKGGDGKFCARSGDRYVPSPRGPSDASELKLVSAVEIPCPVCHEHPIGGVAVFAPADGGSPPPDRPVD